MNKFKLKQNKKGFTLVELIIVIVIIGILAAIAIPSMIGFTEDAKEKEAIANCKSVYNAAAAALTDSLTSPTAVTVTQVQTDIRTLLGVPTGSSNFGNGTYAVTFDTVVPTETPTKITKVTWTANGGSPVAEFEPGTDTSIQIQ